MLSNVGRGGGEDAKAGHAGVNGGIIEGKGWERSEKCDRS